MHGRRWVYLQQVILFINDGPSFSVSYKLNESLLQ